MPPPESGLPQPGARAVFVYYRVRPSNGAALEKAFADVAVGIGGWQPRLMRKVDEDGHGKNAARDSPGQGQEHLQTWMEVYRSPAEAPQSNDAIRSLIDGCVRSAGIFELIEGGRHYEIFEPCA